MFKFISTLVRARSHDAAEALSDANAMSILRQQLRDATQGLEAAKRSVAVTMAYAEREKTNAQRIEAQLADLETRACAALAQDKLDLAQEAAEVIAQLEEERAVSQQAIATYTAQIRKLREEMSLAEQRLRALQRGKQLAEATDRTQRLRGAAPAGVVSSIAEAEATLKRLQDRQSLTESTETALAALSLPNEAETTRDRLAAAGCGPAQKSSASAVLDRLKAKAQ
ncbi:PspA/IM30 family protein [Thioclava sp. GXIMD4215]|uniref:PspA/IM30 family protein n=1 Tax=Thioclava sp. GXIMD4215 TaxID=3131928 RepID=UPI00311B16F8